MYSIFINIFLGLSVALSVSPVSMASDSAAQGSYDTCKAQFVLRWVTSSHFYPFFRFGKKSEKIKLRLERFVKIFSVTILYLVHLFGIINPVTSHAFVFAATLVHSFIFFLLFFIEKRIVFSLFVVLLMPFWVILDGFMLMFWHFFLLLHL